ncbi:hypothetical protein D9756_005620 [Leucocoprinus leucothites]|uniref:Uncharacterized protein n=1 Tax=Leucocoprinus leucothites TaxID=201217 RepID=A0A8H5FZG2_9AGAR|nr:hypothetical protein D9756_005620 [Leucoagaricus leucothites]
MDFEMSELLLTLKVEMKSFAAATAVIACLLTATVASPVPDNTVTLPPCPTDWKPIFGHGPVCDPNATPTPTLPPCPTDWNPKFGHGPVCDPNATPTPTA